MAEGRNEVPSVQARVEEPQLVEAGSFWSQIVTWKRVADGTPAWGAPARAWYLDDFWRSDRMLPGVVYTMVSRIGSLGWSLTGPVDGLRYWHSMILDSDGGYSDLIRLLAQDYLCTDVGAVLEEGRAFYPLGPIEQLWHMDARLCIPGPVTVGIKEANGSLQSQLCDLVFSDVDGYKCLQEGHFHRFASLPATDQTRRRLGFCFLSRALRAAKLANFLTEYQEEELKDMPPEGIATASGITAAQIQTAILQHEAQQQGKQQFTYPGILWIVGNALGQEVKLEWHPFRRLWEKFDERTAWEVFMKTLALDAGLDVAELWQIETTGATKAQVSIQHRKAMGKGPAEFLVDFERTMNRQILPNGYVFAFDQRDDDQDLLVENIRSMRIRNVRELWRTDPATGEGLIDRRQALEMLAEEGVLPTRFVSPPEGRLTDIIKEVTGKDIATMRRDGTLERHRDYFVFNSQKEVAPLPFAEISLEISEESLRKDSGTEPDYASRRKQTEPLRGRMVSRMEDLFIPAQQDLIYRLQYDLPLDEAYWESLGEGWASALESALMEALREAAISVSFDLINEPAMEWARRRAFELVRLDGPESAVRSISEQLERIREQLGTGELPWLELQGRLGEIFSDERAWRIAETEITTSFTTANRLVAREEGMTEKRLLTANDRLVCFPAWTPVETDGGPVPIQWIEPGDLVQTREGFHEVSRASRRTFEGRMFRVEAELRSLVATEDHPFWTVGRGWVKCGDLNPGEFLETFSKRSIEIDRVSELVRKPVRVYNLEIEGPAEFFANGILVHNCAICRENEAAGWIPIDDPYPFSYGGASKEGPAIHPSCRCSEAYR